MLERFLERPRHVEVQVFGDAHGGCVHLFERECSVQRRYQKIIEESPSPFIDAATRAAMTAAAVRAAQAVGYVNAGTIEFIIGADGRFYFMEMNTRLQVEHPVTESVTGLDLVEWQLRIASGERLPLEQSAIRQQGHAIEARIYSEDPRRGFLPSVGRVRRFVHPPAGEDWRIDAGIADGDAISVHYDPMIAKVIASGPDRAAALATLRRNLDRTAVFGVANNLPLLRAIAAHPAFAAGDVDTGFVDRELAALTAGSSARAGGAPACREPCARGAQAGGRRPFAVVPGRRLANGRGARPVGGPAHAGLPANSRELPQATGSHSRAATRGIRAALNPRAADAMRWMRAAVCANSS